MGLEQLPFAVCVRCSRALYIFVNKATYDQERYTPPPPPTPVEGVCLLQFNYAMSPRNIFLDPRLQNGTSTIITRCRIC